MTVESQIAKPHYPGISIRNFGRVTDNFYRGGQPRVEEYGQLPVMGIKTVIDLTDEHDHQGYAQAAIAKAGLMSHWLPMSDRDYPSETCAQTFLDTVEGIKHHPVLWQPVFVHCAGGRHRTGAMIAVYRMKVDGWDLKRAMKELESYFGFWHGWWGHQQIKKFVEDYWAKIQEGK